MFLHFRTRVLLWFESMLVFCSELVPRESDLDLPPDAVCNGVPGGRL